MKKPVLIAVLISVAAFLFISRFSLWFFECREVAILFVAFLFVGIYIRSRLWYAINQWKVFTLSYLGGLFIVSSVVWLRFYNNPCNLVINCSSVSCKAPFYATLDSISSSRLYLSFWIAIYTLIFVLQLPEKKC